MKSKGGRAIRIALTGLALAGVLGVGTAPTSPVAAETEVSSPVEKVQSTIDQLVAKGVPGATVHIRIGDREWDVSGGVADLSTGRPAGPNDRVRIGSITKAFTAVVMLQLEAEGKLDLDDTVEQWLPGLIRGNGNDGSGITLRMLLNHSSGLPDYGAAEDKKVFKSYFATNDYDRVWRPRQLVKLALTQPPMYPPGEKATYSNTGYVLAGMIISRATGHPVSTEVRRRIIEPLRLRDTFYPDTRPTIPGRHMRGYLSNFYYDYTDVTRFSPSWAGAAGAMISTATDVATFERAVFSGRLLPPEQMRELRDAVPTPIPGTSNGLGFTRTVICERTVWSKDGAFPGYGSDAASTQNGSRQVVITTNSDSSAFGTPETRKLIAKVKRLVMCA